MSVNVYDASQDKLIPIAGIPIDGENFIGTQQEWANLSRADKARYDSSTGVTVNFTDDDMPDDIIGDTDISGIGDGTLTGGLASVNASLMQLESFENFSSSLSTHAFVGNYLDMFRCGKFVHLVGLIGVTAEVPQNTNWLYVNSSKCYPQHATQIPLIRIEGTGNNVISFASSGSNHFTNDRTQIPAGSYCINTWWEVE